MNNRRTMGTILLALVMLSGTPAASPAMDSCANIPAEFFVRNARKPDRSRTVIASVALRRVKNRQDMALVDVRGSGDFERFRIPGSINVPLYFVKTKSFLTAKPFLLIDEGYRYKLLASECRRLADAGLPCSVLYGGLTAWRDEEGAMEGEYAAWEKLGNMTATLFSREKDLEGWLMVDASERKGAESLCLVPEAVHVPFTGTSGQFASQIRDILRPRQADPFARVLILNEKGTGYDSIRFLVRKAGLKHIFFLEGGLEQYAQYLSRQTLSAMPRGERLKTTDGCGSTCGGKK